MNRPSLNSHQTQSCSKGVFGARKACLHAAGSRPSAVCGAGTAKVQFKIQQQVNFGDSHKIVGNAPELGQWNAGVAPEMAWGEGDVWTLDVDVAPGSDLEFKVVRVNNGHIEWEGGNNHKVQVPKDEAAQVSIGLSWSQEEVQLSVGSSDAATHGSTNGANAEDRGSRASTPVRSSRPSTPSPNRGRPSSKAPRSSSYGGSDPNANLLEQAMAARAQGASSRSSSRSSTPSPTRGRAPTQPPTHGRSSTPVRSSRPSYEAPRSSSNGGSDPNANLLEQAMAARSRSSSRSSTPSRTRGRAPTPPPTRGRSSTPTRSSRPSYEAPRSNGNGGSDPNANLLEQAMAARSRSSSRSSTPSPTRGRAPPARSSTPARSSRPSYEAPKSSGSDPNANLLEQAMAARAQGASSRSSSRSSTPAPTRGRSSTPVRSSRPSTPSPTRGRPSYEAPRSNGNGGSGANDNLLAIALAERAKGGSSRSSSRGRTPTPSPTRGRSSTPVRSSRPSTPSPTRGRPSYKAPKSNGIGDNDNLLAAAMAYRQQNSGRSGGRSSGRGADAGSSRK